MTWTQADEAQLVVLQARKQNHDRDRFALVERMVARDLPSFEMLNDHEIAAIFINKRHEIVAALTVYGLGQE